MKLNDSLIQLIVHKQNIVNMIREKFPTKNLLCSRDLYF